MTIEVSTTDKHHQHAAPCGAVAGSATGSSSRRRVSASASHGDSETKTWSRRTDGAGGPTTGSVPIRPVGVSCRSRRNNCPLAGIPGGRAAGPACPGDRRTARPTLRVAPPRADTAGARSCRSLRRQPPQPAGRAQQTTGIVGYVAVTRRERATTVVSRRPH